MLRSLYRLGFDWEALEYFAFVLEAVAGGSGDFSLQIMYGIDGRKDLTESTLDHLSGWRNSRPVRVGNGAWDQHQNDVWGMLLDAVDIHLRQGAAQIVKPVWEGVAKFVESAITHAGDPDQGIWEIRGEPAALHGLQGPVLGGHGPRRRHGPDPPGPRAGREVAARRPTS